MTYRLIFALLFLAGCNAPIITLNQAKPASFHLGMMATAKSIPYTILAEGEAAEAPTPTLVQFRNQGSLTDAWESLPFYKHATALPPTQLRHMDFEKESVYLVGIPYAYLTDDPKIVAVVEKDEAIVMQYRTVRRGQVSLPATKTHYIAIALKASAKQLRLQNLEAAERAE